MTIYSVIGVMSGTSLDGLDLAYCTFYRDETWNFKIVGATTYPYSPDMLSSLKNAGRLSAYNFIKLHKEYGAFIGNCVNKYLKEMRFPTPDLIASHGHTIFHEPEAKMNFQLGDGNVIAAVTNITTVCDFRSLNIACNGQGAPLVPFGDELLFNEFDYCLNLGGFANISFSHRGGRAAYDICAFNVIANHYANMFSQSYDKDGEIGRSGKINIQLLNEINNLEYFYRPTPKSLGIEWVKEVLFLILDKYNIPLNDKLRTYYQHAAIKIAEVNPDHKRKSIFITGGGAYNKFFIEILAQNKNLELIIPDSTIIEYKEALIFGLLGVLRTKNFVNARAITTGARCDNSLGTVILI